MIQKLLTWLGSTILRKHLDEVPLWQGDHGAPRRRTIVADA
jgi:hypothetical protein